MRFPKFSPTDEQRELVKRLRLQGKSQVVIAEKLSLAETTLRRYFTDELAVLPQGPGRPRFEPTDEQREEVEILIAARVKRESIATHIGIDGDTLALYFEDELAKGFHRKNSAMWLNIYRLAMSGNVTAAKYWLDRVGILPQPADQPKPGNVDQATARHEPIGKKDQANAEAASAGAGTEWGDDLMPKGALN